MAKKLTADLCYDKLAAAAPLTDRARPVSPRRRRGSPRTCTTSRCCPGHMGLHPRAD